MNFYDRVKELVKNKGYNLITFLQSLGISYETYKSAKRLNNLPKTNETLKIAAALNVSVEYLVTGKGLDIEPDIKEAMLLLQSLPKEKRLPIIAIIKSQVDFWKTATI